MEGEYRELVVGAVAALHGQALLARGALPLALEPLAHSVAAPWRADAGRGGRLLTDNRAPIDCLANPEILRGGEQVGAAPAAGRGAGRQGG